MATKSGTVKKSALTEFSNPRSTGIIAVTLDGKTSSSARSSLTARK